ncbi:hypothetical protein ES708_13181 [subsurface metagenome]
MSTVKTILCFRSHLLRKGLVQYISSIVPNPDVKYYQDLETFHKNKSPGSPIIFLEYRLIHDPCVFCLDKIKRAYPDCRIIAISDTKIPDDLIPYFEVIINLNDTDEGISGKLNKIYNTVESVNYSRGGDSILSEREMDVLKYVALGFTNKEIGDRLYISTHTVITHRKNITAKLGIKTIAGLTIYAVLNGIISSDKIKK